ncbi:MAG: twin-arginine translocase TatA/TatE family subunit [Gaiellaceae bacterium]
MTRPKPAESVSLILVGLLIFGSNRLPSVARPALSSIRLLRQSPFGDSPSYTP